MSPLYAFALPTGPYAVPHHNTYPDKAYPFGVDPATYQNQGFEHFTVLIYTLCFGICAVGFAVKKDSGFKVQSNLLTLNVGMAMIIFVLSNTQISHPFTCINSTKGF